MVKFLLLMLLSSSVWAVEPLKIIDRGEHGYIEYVEQDWKKYEYVDDRAIYINTGNIEKQEYLRHVYAMVQFVREPRRIAGIGINVGVIISEATLDCKNHYLIPVRDFYLTREFEIIKFITYEIGRGLVKANEPGTIAEAMYQTACDPI